MDEKVTYRCIATTQDTGDPVFYVAKGESHMEVILDTTDKCINVWYVTSKKKGDMKAMMDHLVDQVPTNKVRFISPMSSEEKDIVDRAIDGVSMPHLEFNSRNENDRDIRDALNGFKEEVLEFDNKKTTALVGEWIT
jgi:protein gp37